jgi:lipid-A-disaccharide synthase
LLPGSRSSEVKRILPHMLGAAKILKQSLSNCQFILPVAPTVRRGEVEPLTSNELALKVTEGSIYNVMKVSDIIVTASGTATVEAAIMNVPMVVVYRVSLLSYFVAKMLVRVDHIGMVNLIAGERVVPELIQDEATPERIAHECLRIIKDQSLAISIKNRLKTVRDRLGSGGASKKAALLAYGLIGRH